jgi:DNA-binding NtrC family response regulator
VFLDEVGELPLDAQAALLRFLGTGEVRPVGLARALHVDVRVLAATHRDLPAAIRGGTFREDLYYRLRDVVLRVPPLRERPDDLPVLVEHCRRRFNERYGLAIDGLTPAAARVLAAHCWPGNVRELEAVLREAMVLKGRGWLDVADLALGPALATPPASPASRARRSSAIRPATRCLRIALELAETRGSISRGEVAAESGFSRELARRALADLARLGHLRRLGRGRGTRYVVP